MQKTIRLKVKNASNDLDIEDQFSITLEYDKDFIDLLYMCQDFADHHRVDIIAHAACSVEIPSPELMGSFTEGKMTIMIDNYFPEDMQVRVYDKYDPTRYLTSEYFKIEDLKEEQPTPKDR